MMMFLNSFASEWMKMRRSLALWMVFIGGFFTPALVTVIRLFSWSRLPEIYSRDEDLWRAHWQRSWESMAVFLLPLGAILATSLIAQIEYKNNTWKQLHALPLSYTTIFFSKLAVILVLMALFFVLFNIGIWLSAVLPYLLMIATFDPLPVTEHAVTSPFTGLPWQYFLTENAFYFIGCLPIVALQYLLALRFKNFLVGVGLGFLFWVGAIAALSWRFGYVIPYTYTMYNYLKGVEKTRAVAPEVNIQLMALAWFAVFTAVSFVMYVTRREKG